MADTDTINVVEARLTQLKDAYDASVVTLNREIESVTDPATKAALKNHLLSDAALKQLNGSKLTESLQREQTRVKTAIDAQAFTAADLAKKEAIKTAVENLHKARSDYTQKKVQILEHKKRIKSIEAVNSGYNLPNATPEEHAELDAARTNPHLRLGGMLEGDVENTLNDFNIMEKLNEKNDHLTPTNPKASSQIQYINNVLSCDHADALANAARAKGGHKFTFSKAPLFDKGTILNNAIEHMLRVGMEDVSCDENIKRQIPRMSRANRKHYETLERICDASRSAYQNTTENAVFSTNAYSHQVATFLRIPSEADQRAYLTLLKKDNNDIEKQFIKELKQHNERFSDGTAQYTPEEYFTKIMARGLPNRVSSLKKQLDSLSQEEIRNAAAPLTAEFNTKLTADERFAYFKTIPATLVKQVWQNLQPSPQHRAELLQRMINEHAGAALASKPVIQQEIATLLQGMNAEELRRIREQLHTAFDGKDLNKNLSLVAVKEIITKLGGKDYDAVAHTFSPKVFFNKNFDIELTKECNLQHNTAKTDLEARLRCYQMQMKPTDQKGSSKLKKEITEIVKRFEADQDTVKACIKDAITNVFGAGNPVSADLINHTDHVDATQRRGLGAIFA